MSLRARILPLGLALVLAAAALAGCGGVTLDPVARAATRTGDAGSYRFSYSLSVRAPQTNETQALSGTGLVDAAAKRLSMTLGIAGQQAETIMDLSSSPIFYMRMPELEANLPAGKRWLAIDLGEVAQANGLDLGTLSPAELDPTSVFDTLEQSRYSTKVGAERLGGVETTHYLVTVDPQELLQGEAKAQRQLTEKLLQAAGITSYPVDVWIDGAGLLRRVTIELGGGASAPFAMTMRMDMRDYGADLHVGLPPAAEVADGAQYLPAHRAG